MNGAISRQEAATFQNLLQKCKEQHTKLDLIKPCQPQGHHGVLGDVCGCHFTRTVSFVLETLLWASPEVVWQGWPQGLSEPYWAKEEKRCQGQYGLHGPEQPFS